LFKVINFNQKRVSRDAGDKAANKSGQITGVRVNGVYGSCPGG